MLTAFSRIINGKIYVMFRDKSEKFIQLFTDKGNKLQFKHMDEVSSFIDRKQNKEWN